VSLRRQVALAALLLVALTALAALLTGGQVRPGSTLSREPHGWIVARRYAEERGVEVRLIERLADPPGKGWALFFVFPWQRTDVAEVHSYAVRHLLAGGTLVMAYTGTDRPASIVPERRVLDALGLVESAVDAGPPSRHPFRWREAQQAEWPLLPVGQPRPAQPAHVTRTRLLPRAPRMTALYENADGKVLVSRLPRVRGHILLLPAEALANGRLSQPGNAALLETLIERLPPRWAFDEYHHDVFAAHIEGGGGHSGRAFVLFFVHVAFFYLLAVLGLVRRFGPPWREPLIVSGSVRSFFVGVGALHARRGHQRQAAMLLVERARALDPKLVLSENRAAGVGRDDAAFVSHARAVARAQQRRK